MAPTPQQRAARWLLAFVLLLILVGSLQPFELRHVAFHSPLELLLRLRWGISTPADMAANVLLYLPLGATLVFALPERLGAGARVAIATLCGCLLSLSVEIAQWFIVTRVASLADVTTNTTGALLGAGAGVTVRALGERLARSETLRVTREPFGAALVCVWIGTFLPPWLPHAVAARWPALLARHVAAGWPGVAPVALQALGWLIVAVLLRALTRRALVWPVLALLAAVTLSVRYTVFAPFAGNAEPVGAALAVAAWPLADRLAERWLLRLLLVALAAGLLYRGLAPFEFVARPQHFHLVPFTDLVSRGSSGFNLPLLFGKAFWYGSLVWLLVAAGARAVPAGLAAAGALLALEIVQAWTPAGGHFPTMTDPAVALSAGFVLWLFERMRGAAPARRPAPRGGR